MPVIILKSGIMLEITEQEYNDMTDTNRQSMYSSNFPKNIGGRFWLIPSEIAGMAGDECIVKERVEVSIPTPKRAPVRRKKAAKKKTTTRKAVPKPDKIEDLPPKNVSTYTGLMGDGS